MNEARRIRSEKLRENFYIEGYARCLENKRVEWMKTEMLSKCGSR